jgi:hypothetical protein
LSILARVNTGCPYALMAAPLVNCAGRLAVAVVLLQEVAVELPALVVDEAMIVEPDFVMVVLSPLIDQTSEPQGVDQFDGG